MVVTMPPSTSPSFRELSRIALTVVSRVDPDLRDDTHQELWLKFLRWPPRTLSYAWSAANSARDSFWRKERTWRQLRDEGPEVHHNQMLAHVRTAVRNSSLARSLSPKERKRRDRVRYRRNYHANLAHSRTMVRERVRRHRQRLKAAA